MAEMHFPDEAALIQGMKSPEMADARANLATCSEGLARLMFAREESVGGWF